MRLGVISLGFRENRCDIEVGLAAEVTRNQRGVDPRAVAYLPGCRAFESPPAEQLLGCEQQRQPAGRPSRGRAVRSAMPGIELA